MMFTGTTEGTQAGSFSGLSTWKRARRRRLFPRTLDVCGDRLVDCFWAQSQRAIHWTRRDDVCPFLDWRSTATRLRVPGVGLFSHLTVPLGSPRPTGSRQRTSGALYGLPAMTAGRRDSNRAQ